MQDEYDVGILMSTDTDLKPALEGVTQLTNRRAEVAAWSSPRQSFPALEHHRPEAVVPLARGSRL